MMRFPPASIRYGMAAALCQSLVLATAPASAGFLDGIFGPSDPPRQESAPAPAAPAPVVVPQRPAVVTRPPAAAPKVERRAAAVPLPLPRPAGLVAPAPAPTAAAKPAPAPSAAPAATPVKAEAAPPVTLQPAATRPPPAAVARDGFTAAEVATVQRIDAWFNSFDHLVGTFTQIAPDGARSRGRFFLEKPGKLRFQYALPSTLDIVSNGRTIAVVDHKLDTSDVYPLSQTPLRFLLKQHLDLFEDAHVASVNSAPGRASVTVEERSRIAGTSRLTVVFGGNPFALKQWTVTDPQGLDTTVMVDHLDSQQIPPEQAFTIN